MTVLERLGAEIRVKRQHSGMSQEELASKCGLHRTYIGSVERGERNISIKNLLRLADALGCSLSSLVRSLDKWEGENGGRS